MPVPTTITSHTTCSASRAIQLAVSQNRAPQRMMAQSYARFGRITNVPSAATDRRVEVPASGTVETWVSDATGDPLSEGIGEVSSIPPASPFFRGP